MEFLVKSGGGPLPPCSTTFFAPATELVRAIAVFATRPAPQKRRVVNCRCVNHALLGVEHALCLFGHAPPRVTMDELYERFSEFTGLGVVVVVLVGILTVCVTVLLVFRRSKQPGALKSGKLDNASDGTQVPPLTSSSSSKAAKSKGAKQWKPRKHSHSTHPLLAADFKGHTGAVLSLDFELGGKYLVSCSEGEF